MTSERLQGEEQFHSKSYLLEITCFHGKMRVKSVPQKLNFVMAKAISKSLQSISAENIFSLIVMHEKTALFFIKDTLIETKNIIFSKNY